VLVVGCFELEQLSRLRWRVTNALTSITHVTYGSEAEVVEQLTAQTVAWRKRVAKGELRMTKGSFRGPSTKPKDTTRDA
jgi:hypothetical protein